MIKCKKGRVVLRGDKPTIVAEFICLAKSIYTVAEKELDEVVDAMEQELKGRKESVVDENETVADPEHA